MISRVIHSAFLSHTSEFSDGGFIEAAHRALRRAGWFGVEMAEYPAVDLEAAYYDAEQVAAAEIYVGIIGFDYGTPVTGRDVSYTEHEFDTATRLGKYRLLLLLREKLTDKEPDKRQLAFRAKVKAVPAIHVEFQTPDELELKLFDAVLRSRERIETHRARALRLRSLRGGRAPVAFSPRDWLTGKIDEFLEKYPSGYFFVEGKTGVGKSTLIAHLADARGWACHLTSDDKASRTTAVALQRLTDQLVERFELDELRELEVRSTATFAVVLEQAAAAVSEGKGKAVLLVDGLEKADDVTPMPFGLPSELPDGVYVVATMREGFEVTGAARERSYDSVVIDPHGPQAIEDVRNHVEWLLETDPTLRGRAEKARAADNTFTKTAFTEALVRHCGGVWIHLSLVLQGIREETIELRELPNLAKGLWPYYSRTFDDLAAAHPGAALPAISTLACVAEPVDLDTLVTLAGVEDKEGVRALMTGALRNFVHTTDADDPSYSVMHDSLRDYFTGQRPPDRMTGDETRIDRLRRAARDTHQRIVRRYWPSDAALTSVGQLDSGYGLRNLVGHLQSVGRQNDVHRLLTMENGTTNVWFDVHDRHGALNEYRKDLASARLVAGGEVEQEIRAGGTSTAVAREIAYALMDGSVESLSTNVTPGLVRALVEGRVWRPDQAIGWIRAVRGRTARLDLLEALLLTRNTRGRPCVSEVDASGLWDFVLPLHSGRAHQVAGLLLPLLPADRRSELVGDHLPLALDPGYAGRPELFVMLAGSLDADQLDRCVTAALTIEDPRQRFVTALPALVPHAPVATVRKLLTAGFDVPGTDRTRAAIAARLAAEGVEPEWVDEHLVGALYQLHGSPDGARGPLGDGRGPVRAMFETLTAARRQSVLRTVLGHVDRGEHWKVAIALAGLAEFLEGAAVDIALRMARRIDERCWPGAHAYAVAAVATARPELAAEALRALPPLGSSDDHARVGTLRLLAGHLAGARAFARQVDVLPAEQRCGLVPAAEGLDIAARHHGWRRAEMLASIAPDLNHEQRTAALALAAEVDSQRYRLMALDALITGSLDQEELGLASRIMRHVGDRQPRAAAIAALTGHALRSDRPALRARAEELLKSCTGPGRADVLIALGSLREAVAYLPARPEFGDHAFAARLAAVRPVLTGDQVLRMLLDTFSVWYPAVAVDVWAALAPPDSLSDKDWKVVLKTVGNRGPDIGARFYTFSAPHLEKKELRKALERAKELPPPYRALPMATIAAHLDDRARREVGSLLSEEDFAAIDPPTAGALARAMTEPELERLLQRKLSVEALAAMLPTLPRRLQGKALDQATDLLQEFVRQNGADFAPIAAQADEMFLQTLLYYAAFAPDEVQSRARAAVLGVLTPDPESWCRPMSEDNEIGPVRDLFAGMGRPGLMVALAAGAQHVACAVGMEAVVECAAAVDDVARWWP